MISPARVSPSPPASSGATKMPAILAGAALAAGGSWLWLCICAFPSEGWNAVRLAPAVMWWHGQHPYPSPADSPVTTWIYGPVPLVWLLPAAALPGVAAKLMGAAALNAGLLLGTLAFAVVRLAHPGGSRGERRLAISFAVLAAPAHLWLFLQADNWVVALGWLAIGILGGDRQPDPRQLWLVAVVGVLALWAKPTGIGPALGVVAWLGFQQGVYAAARQLVRCLVTGSLFALLWWCLFDPAGLVFNMFVIPASIPWASFVAKLLDPGYMSALTLYGLVPMAGVTVALGHGASRSAAAQLPALWMFLFALPLGVAGFAKLGGNLNSLHAALFLLPSAGLLVARQVRRPSARPARLLTLAAIPALLLTLQLAAAPRLPWAPELRVLRQGAELARQLPDQIYFPWNPLFNFEVTGRFDHVEDGIVTRGLAGHPLSVDQLRDGLPRALRVVAYSGMRYEGVLPALLIPSHAQESRFGEWRLVHWTSSP